MEGVWENADGGKLRGGGGVNLSRCRLQVRP